MNIPALQRWPARIAIALAAVLVAIQVVPFGRNHANPSIVAEPQWDTPETRALAKQACFDCHSNETQWPAYSRVAPVSWLVYQDVTEGRAALNFSEWTRLQEEAKEAAEVLREGEMPPAVYRIVHPDARLNAQERERLARGLAATLGNGSGNDDR